jgi:hypothetical protein
MTGRKSIVHDGRVIAALQAFKLAVLKATGSSEVKNLVVLIEADSGAAENDVGLFYEICNCPNCVANIRRTIYADLDAAEAEYAKAPMAVH